MCSLSVAASYQFQTRLGTSSIAPAFHRERQCDRCDSGFLLCWRRWPPLECVDHCHPFFLQDVPETGRPPNHLFLGESLLSRLGFVVIHGDTHPIIKVRHDVERASLRRVLKRPSEPSCDSAQVPRLLASCACSSLQLWRSIECSHHVPRLPGSLVHKNGHSCGHVREARLFVPPISLRSAAHVC